MPGQLHVDCERSLSCIGNIRIDAGGTTGILGTRVEKNIESYINCGVEDDACIGGLYQFHGMKHGTIIGNVRESIITFKDVNRAEILINSEDNQKEMMFFRNNVLFENVHFIDIHALAPHSMTGSVINLGGIVASHTDTTDIPINFYCYGQGSCSGSIILLKKCGNAVHIHCGNYNSSGIATPQSTACDHLVIAVRLHPSCTDESDRSIVIHHSDAPPPAGTTPSTIYVLCEESPDRILYFHHCVTVRDDTQTIVNVQVAKTMPDLMQKITQDLENLQKKWDTKKSIITNNLKYLLKQDGYHYYGGVALEAAMGTVFMNGATMGVEATIKHKGDLVKMGIALVGGFSLAATLPLAIPFAVYLGLKGGSMAHKMYKTRALQKKWGMGKGGLDMSAKQRLDNIYDDYNDQFYYSDFDTDELYLIGMGFELDDEGNIVYRDLFAKERQYMAVNLYRDDSDINKHSVDDSTSMISQYTPNRYNVIHGGYEYNNNNHLFEPPLYALILSLCIAVIALCCVIYCCVLFVGYYICSIARGNKREHLYEMDNEMDNDNNMQI
eukprot:182308_1